MDGARAAVLTRLIRSATLTSKITLTIIHLERTAAAFAPRRRGAVCGRFNQVAGQWPRRPIVGRPLRVIVDFLDAVTVVDLDAVGIHPVN